MNALLRALPARATASGAQRRHVGTLALHAALPFQLPQPPRISSPVQENPVAPHAEDHEDASDALDFQVIADDGPAALQAAQRTAFIAWAVEQARSSRDLRAMVRMAEAAASQAAALQCLLDPADVGHVLEGYRVLPEFQKMHRRMLDAAAAWRAAGEQYGAAQAIFSKLHPEADAGDARIQAAQAACESAERQLFARHQVFWAARRSHFPPMLNSRLQRDIQAHLVQCLRQACDSLDADAALNSETLPRYGMDSVLCWELAGMVQAAAQRLECLRNGALSVPAFVHLPAAERAFQQKEWTSRFIADAEALEVMARRLRAAWGDALLDPLPVTQAAADALRENLGSAVRVSAWKETCLRRSFGLLLDSLGTLRSRAESTPVDSCVPGLRQLERLRQLCGVLHTAASLPRVLERSLQQWTAAEREGSAAFIASLCERAIAQAQAHEQEAQALLDKAFLALWQSGSALLGGEARSGFSHEVPALDLPQLASWARAAGVSLKAMPLPAAGQGSDMAVDRLPTELRLQGFFALADACELLGQPPAGTQSALQRAERLRTVARSARSAARGAMAEPLQTLARQCDAAHTLCLVAAVRAHAAEVSQVFAQSRPTLEAATDRLGADLFQSWHFAFMPALVQETEAEQAPAPHASSAGDAPAETTLPLLESVRSIASEVDALHRLSIPMPQEMPPDAVQEHRCARETLDVMVYAARVSSALLALWQETPFILLPCAASSRTARAAEFVRRAISVDLDVPVPVEHAAGADAMHALSLAREVRRRGRQMIVALKTMQQVFQVRTDNPLQQVQQVQHLRRIRSSRLNAKFDSIDASFDSSIKFVTDLEAELQSEIRGDERDRAGKERRLLADWRSMLEWRLGLEKILMLSRIAVAIQTKELDEFAPDSEVAKALVTNVLQFLALIRNLTYHNKKAQQLGPLRENRPLMATALRASLTAIRQMQDCDERTQLIAAPCMQGAGGSRAGAGGPKQARQRRRAP
ncbi:type III secretion system effector protein XopU [Xanthomonas oryzae]|uniref:type III secretion system effector protein XopU n=1 Tax=Xanthomonas oryzae TaxID=347 RepID=UPI002155B9BA|nr:type III secretion system effector protein XopU [Xanthomonas oryzae]